MTKLNRFQICFLAISVSFCTAAIGWIINTEVGEKAIIAALEERTPVHLNAEVTFIKKQMNGCIKRYSGTRVHLPWLKEEKADEAHTNILQSCGESFIANADSLSEAVHRHSVLKEMGLSPITHRQVSALMAGRSKSEQTSRIEP